MKFKDIVERTTININQKDSVLRFAAIQNGISRLGRPDISDLTEKEGKLVLEAIQSDKLDLLNVGDSEPLEITGAHDSWYNHPWVSSDLLLLMLFNATPEERGLVKYRLGNGEEGYYFPEDYDHIIRDIIKKGRTEFEQDFLKAKEKGAIREEASLTN